MSKETGIPRSPGSDSENYFHSAAGSVASSPRPFQPGAELDDSFLEPSDSEETRTEAGETSSHLNWDSSKFEETDLRKIYRHPDYDDEEEEEEKYEYEDDEDDYADMLAEWEVGPMGRPNIYPDDIYLEQFLEDLKPVKLFTDETILEDARGIVFGLAISSLQKKGVQTTVDQMVMNYNEITNKKDDNSKDSYFETFTQMVLGYLVKDPAVAELVKQDKANFFKLNIFKDIIQYDLATGRVIAIPPNENLRLIAEEIQRSVDNAARRVEGKKAMNAQLMDTPAYKLKFMHGCNFLMNLITITANEKMQEKVSWNAVRDVYDKMPTENASQQLKQLYKRFENLLSLKEYPLMNSKVVKSLFGRSSLAQSLAHPIFSGKVGYEQGPKDLLVFVKNKKTYTTEELAAVEKVVEAEKQKERQRYHRNNYAPHAAKKDKKTREAEERAKNFEPIQLDDGDYLAAQIMTQEAKDSPPPIPRHRQEEKRPEPRTSTPVEKEEPVQQQQVVLPPKQPSLPVVRQQQTAKDQGATYQPPPPAFTFAKKKKEKMSKYYSDAEDSGDEAEDEEEKEPEEKPKERNPLPPPRDPAAIFSFFQPTQHNTVDLKENTTNTWMTPVKREEEKAATPATKPATSLVQEKAIVKPLIYAEADFPEDEKTINIAPRETKNEKMERIEQFIEVQKIGPPPSEQSLTPVKSPPSKNIPTDDDDFDDISDVESARTPDLTGMNMEGPLFARPQMPNELHPIHAQQKEEAMRRQRKKLDAEKEAQRAKLTPLPPFTMSKFAKDDYEAEQAKKAEEEQRREEEKKRRRELARLENEKREAERRQREAAEREQKEKEERARQLEEVRIAFDREEREKIAREFQQEQIGKLEAQIQERKRLERVKMVEAEEETRKKRRTPPQGPKERYHSGKETIGSGNSAFKRRTRGSEEGEEPIRLSPVSKSASGSSRLTPAYTERDDGYRLPNPPKCTNSRNYGPPDERGPPSYGSSNSHYPQDGNSRYSDRYDEPPRDSREYTPYNDRGRSDSGYGRGYAPARGQLPKGPLPPNRPSSSNYQDNPMYSSQEAYHEPPPPSFSRPSSTAPSNYSQDRRGGPAPPAPKSRLNDRDDFVANMTAQEVAQVEIDHQRCNPDQIPQEEQFLNFIGNYVYAYRADTAKLKWSNIRQGLSAPLNNPERIFFGKSWMDVVNKHFSHVSVIYNSKTSDYVFSWD